MNELNTPHRIEKLLRTVSANVRGVMMEMLTRASPV